MKQDQVVTVRGSSQPIIMKTWLTLISMTGCRKGKRECIYPEPSSAIKTRRGSPKGRSKEEDELSSPDSGSGLDMDNDVTPLSAVHVSRHVSDRNVPTTPEIGKPSVLQFQNSTKEESPGVKTVDTLPEDQRFYLNYVHETLWPHHYVFNLDESGFLSHTLIDTALQFDPLLYAVVCFGAYHHTIHRPDGQISHFLKYHNASVKSLRESLGRGQKNFATVLTILQLATIEVSLQLQAIKV
jgi:hypothetical protein